MIFPKKLSLCLVLTAVFPSVGASKTLLEQLLRCKELCEESNPSIQQGAVELDLADVKFDLAQAGWGPEFEVGLNYTDNYFNSSIQQSQNLSLGVKQDLFNYSKIVQVELAAFRRDKEKEQLGVLRRDKVK